jgi:hypothetical protein
MNRIAYAILVVPGAILYGAGSIMTALSRGNTTEWEIMTGVGVVIGLIGLIGFFIAGAVRPTTPVPGRKGDAEEE